MYGFCVPGAAPCVEGLIVSKLNIYQLGNKSRRAESWLIDNVGGGLF
jgi:hypothetical protein